MLDLKSFAADILHLSNWASAKATLAENLPLGRGAYSNQLVTCNSILPVIFAVWYACLRRWLRPKCSASFHLINI